MRSKLRPQASLLLDPDASVERSSLQAALAKGRPLHQRRPTWGRWEWAPSTGWPAGFLGLERKQPTTMAPPYPPNSVQPLAASRPCRAT